MDLIKLKIDTSEAAVAQFLCTLHNVLDSKEFDINKDVTFILSTKRDEMMIYSNYYTIADLEYDVSDVVDRIKEITVKDFSERIVDVDDLDPPALFVFGKKINKKEVYIKLKIRDKGKKGHILIVSFHYAEHQMVYPFAEKKN